MKYLIVQDWLSTHGNHAGMVHMCRLLCQKYPENYSMLVNNCILPSTRIKNYMKRIYGLFKRNILRHNEYISLCKPMFSKLNNDDEVFLLEYHCPSRSQLEIAKYIRKNHPYVKIIALSHLTPTWYRNYQGYKEMILEWEKYIDKQLTLGSSLTRFFCALGVQHEKISTGFHYVDRDYYDVKEIIKHERPTVITMGALQRDFSLLAEIVRGCPNIHWIICKGRKNVDDMFAGLDNVELKGFLKEDELRHHMTRADISLNVLEDTVGSNVITTSMAMGLAIVVSDVGSIHDYCSAENAIFCENNSHSFIDALIKLSKNKELLFSLRQNAYLKSNDFKIENVDNWFNHLFK